MTVKEFLIKSFAVDHGNFLNVRSKSHDECLAYRCGREHICHTFGRSTVESVRPDIVRDNGSFFPTMTIIIA